MMGCRLPACVKSGVHGLCGWLHGECMLLLNIEAANCHALARTHLDPLARVRHHQMAVKVGLAVLAQALHHGRTQRQVGHKVAILRILGRFCLLMRVQVCVGSSE